MKTIIYTLASLLIIMLFYYYVDLFKSSENESSNETRTAYNTYVISDLAGKTSNEIEDKLGKPSSQENVNPSNTPCPCPKYIYVNGAVEIVFMKGVADWITINEPPERVKKGNLNSYISFDQFSDYTYVKIYTK